ncbi:DUF5661 family protein [uncultured Clostridium sp.]|uniref:DUF5661 family protein n=1 Tax=uncultured Clostridium sp. TaxID=59620 RepID=UPI0026098C33|nr:DUF5661 family protein [uncultured Clostridium sp.]
MKLNILKKFKYKNTTRESKVFSESEALKIAIKLKIDFAKVKFNLLDFTKGMNVELEHGKVNKKTNVTNNNPLLTGKIALAHLNEFPDYYKRLEKLENDANKFWEGQSKFRN